MAAFIASNCETWPVVMKVLDIKKRGATAVEEEGPPPSRENNAERGANENTIYTHILTNKFEQNKDRMAMMKALQLSR